MATIEAAEKTTGVAPARTRRATGTRLPPAAPSTWPLTGPELVRVKAIWREHPGITPPYDGLPEEDAVLIQRYMTGAHPFTALVSINRARGTV
jgi:hypothetical protein